MKEKPRKFIVREIQVDIHGALDEIGAEECAKHFGRALLFEYGEREILDYLGRAACLRYLGLSEEKK